MEFALRCRGRRALVVLDGASLNAVALQPKSVVPPSRGAGEDIAAAVLLLERHHGGHVGGDVLKARPLAPLHPKLIGQHAALLRRPFLRIKDGVHRGRLLFCELSLIVGIIVVICRVVFLLPIVLAGLGGGGGGGDCGRGVDAVLVVANIEDVAPNRLWLHITAGHPREPADLRAAAIVSRVALEIQPPAVSSSAAPIPLRQPLLALRLLFGVVLHPSLVLFFFHVEARVAEFAPRAEHLQRKGLFDGDNAGALVVGEGQAPVSRLGLRALEEVDVFVLLPLAVDELLPLDLVAVHALPHNVQC